MAGQKIGGIIQLTADMGGGGEGLPVSGSFEIEFGGIKRTVVYGQDGLYHGWTEEVVPAKVTGKLIVKKGVDYQAVAEMVNGIVTLTLSPTFVYYLANAVYTGPKKIDTQNGTFDFEVSGDGKLSKL